VLVRDVQGFSDASLTKQGVAVLTLEVGVTGERLLDDSAMPGDEGADTRGRQEAFVIASYAGLYRWFRHLAASPEAAADLTQATFAAFWASAGRKGPEVSSTTWLYAIGRNLWRKWLRDRKAHASGPLDRVAAGGRSPEQRVQDREFWEAAARAVAELPQDLREAFALRFWNEFSYEQIAEVQGVEPGLARWRYFAARRRLHRALADWDPDRGQTPEDHHARSRES
jgi:RNA polymerase sigma factor (sigma-70 family)